MGAFNHSRHLSGGHRQSRGFLEHVDINVVLQAIEEPAGRGVMWTARKLIKVQTEVNLAKDIKGNKKSFFRYVSDKKTD